MPCVQEKGCRGVVSYVESHLWPQGEGMCSQESLKWVYQSQWKLSQLKAGKFLAVRERWISRSHSRWPLQYVAGCSTETDLSLYQGFVNVPVCSFFATSINFWYFLLEVGGLSPPQGEPRQPFSLLRHLVISLSPSLARAVPSPAVWLLLPVWVHVSLWNLVLDTVPTLPNCHSLLTPAPMCW